MRKMTLGIVAHVDAGKTTLSESILYLSGSIKKLGRVDNKDAFLDTFSMEKERGITIFSKQAVFEWKETQFTLLDTPGHVDFSAEMERTLQVLDAAVLVVSAADGVQGHTETLWRLLEHYGIPVFLFINKMDQEGTDQENILQMIQNRLSDHCISFSQDTSSESFMENIAMCEEHILEEFLESGRIQKASIRKLVKQRIVFPCYFGSALKLNGVEELLDGLAEYAENKAYTEEFGAKVYKIARDEKGNRLTYMKVTGGILKVKDLLQGREQVTRESWEEKVNQIRCYQGGKFELLQQADAGTICAVTGLSKTYPGEALGECEQSELPILEPILQYRVILPPDCDANSALLKFRQLEEEEPELHILWEEALQEIQIQLMGEVQTEIIKALIWERFHIEVFFEAGRIVYKETIKNTVEGIGHFEPLRHYAEVHLLMEPGEPGSGMQFAVDCDEDLLDRNWQRLILTHLEEKEHKGVLTGSVITDMKITLIAGKAHLKHTEGGDFRQATYRAVRQGLMQAESALLEPYYEFQMELPTKMVGRAMSDIEKMEGTFYPPESGMEQSVLKGMVPVSTMKDYQLVFTSYTQGKGRLQLTLKGYYPCHNTEEVLQNQSYDPETDVKNPTGSVFCAHGAGYIVPWYEVKEMAHVTSVMGKENHENEWKIEGKGIPFQRNSHSFVEGVTEDELQEIFARTFHANEKKTGNKWKKTVVSKRQITGEEDRGIKRKESMLAEEYLLVDGYNVIFAWEDLKELARIDLHGARTKLMDILCNYQGYKQCRVILVFDAYRVENHKACISEYHNIGVVYTAHAETADQYIEKMAHEMGRKYNVTVATSDGLEQIIIRGQGCRLLSARDLKVEIDRMSQDLREKYLEKKESSPSYLINEETCRQLIKEQL